METPSGLSCLRRVSYSTGRVSANDDSNWMVIFLRGLNNLESLLCSSLLLSFSISVSMVRSLITTCGLSEDWLVKLPCGISSEAFSS